MAGTKVETIAAHQKLFHEPLTREDVEIVVKRALGSSTKLLSYHVKSFSNDKVGFMGTHRHLIVSVQNEMDDNRKPDQHIFFLKSMPYEIEDQVSFMEDTGNFAKEANFFRQLMPELLFGQKDKSWAPQCYLVKDDLLVFEDLGLRNFTTRGQILNTVLLKSALTSLAKLHASSVLAERRLGKSLTELFSEPLRECMFVSEGKFGDWFRTGVEVVVAIAERAGLDSSRLPDICLRVQDKLSSVKKGRKVVCHGDSWSNNLMFDNTQPLPKCVIVDFQLMRYVPAMADVAQLFYLTTRRQFREDNEVQLLEHYWKIFCDTLKQGDASIYRPSFDEILQEYEEMRIVGIVTACLYFPVNQIESKLCLEMTNNSEGFANLLYRHRVGLILGIMNKDPVYAEKNLDIVRELVERSDQLLIL